MPTLSADPLANAIFYAAAIMGLVGLRLHYDRSFRRRTIGGALVLEGVVLLLLGWLRVAHVGGEPVQSWLAFVALFGVVIVPGVTLSRLVTHRRAAADPAAAAALAARDRDRTRMGKAAVLSLPLALAGYIAGALIGGGPEWSPSNGAGLVGAIVGVALATAIAGSGRTLR